MTKKYTIKIDDKRIGRTTIWYANKQNREFDAVLKVKPGTLQAVFEVTMVQFVHPEDCTVIKEWLE